MCRAEGYNGYIYHRAAVEEVKLRCDGAVYRKIRLLLCFFARLAQQTRRRDRVNMIRLTAICVSLPIYIYNETIRLSAEPSWCGEWTQFRKPRRRNSLRFTSVILPSAERKHFSTYRLHRHIVELEINNSK